jgi:7-cyano-7-deazaguanine reductase
MVENKETRRFDSETVASVEVGMLEAIPFEYPGSDTEVSYETDEFTFVCPWTGLPDFATLIITYLPSGKLVELKSLKYYLTSYRNVGILQEHVVNRILDDLVALLTPENMTVIAQCRERGGIRTEVVAEYPRS